MNCMHVGSQQNLFNRDSTLGRDVFRAGSRQGRSSSEKDLASKDMPSHPNLSESLYGR